MSNPFFDHPILNSPYECPTRHWELDESHQPTQQIIEHRRDASFITPIPKSKKQKKQNSPNLFTTDSTTQTISTKGQEYHLSELIDELRKHVSKWRQLPDVKDWRVTPETARLLQHWRKHKFSGIRPFFCQLEAVETAIWLTEVAPKIGKTGQKFIDHLENANNEANPGLSRLALKLATGAGKTTVMAMLIAWQTVNAVRHPASRSFSKAFLVVTPGITIKDRLQVLRPNDPNSYYASRELIPTDMLVDIQRARVVITNFHAFKRREKTEVSKAGRALLTGRHGEEIDTLEPEGQMLQRVIGDLMGEDSIIVFNDEAHHCYREKPGEKEDTDVKADEDKRDVTNEAKANNEAARLWISGLEIIQQHQKRGIGRIFDLSATPFFLRGSGYAEGTLFPWTMSDFSLMDAIECGIVKLPRVPVADNVSSGDMPIYRDLWTNIRKDMPKAGRGKGGILDPQELPTHLTNAIKALYGHYEKTSALWDKAAMGVPPCFIIVCNNTSTSKLIYDYISGYERTLEDGTTNFHPGKFSLFSNFDENGNPLSRMRTLLIDSEQLESGEKLSDDFKKVNAKAIETFHREIMTRGGPLAEELRQGKEIDDTTLLREVMNTVGKVGQLGGDIRCVVSVSMLTEGWDANTVTHVLGVRAFGTQLLCEQVVGRALRRQSYDLNDEGLFNVEYADVLGIPFDFTAKPVVAPPAAPRKVIRVHSIKDRNALEVRFPRVSGYRVELPKEKLRAEFTDDSTLELNPDLVGPTEVLNAGIIGATENLKVEHQKDIRFSALLMHLTNHLMQTKWRDENGDPRTTLYGDLKNIAKQWLQNHLTCVGGTYPAILLDLKFADMACEKIQDAINRAGVQDAPGEPPVLAVLEPYNPTGSTMHVNFMTTKEHRWQTDSRFCHLNWVILDSDWEGEFCRVLEKVAAERLEAGTYPRIKAYVKNHNLGFEVPYIYQGQERLYRPDFIITIDGGKGENDLLNLVVEIKGYRGEDAKAKKQVMDVYWVPGMNRLGAYGRWAFAEFREIFKMEADFEAKIKAEMIKMIEQAIAPVSSQTI